MLSLLLVMEGISFGMFLTAGNAFVTQHADAQMRGASLGAYNMAGGVSIALSPILLGALAQNFGLGTVFLGMGVAALAGTAVLAVAFPRALSTARQ